jgi:hypothetical protein
LTLRVLPAAALLALLLANRDRFIPYDAGRWLFSADNAGKISASIYSLPSTFFEPADVVPFLSAVRRMAPRRTVLLLVDSPMARSLAGPAARLDLRLVHTGDRAFTPWARDTFSLVKGARGQVVVLVRPSSPLQTGRESDNAMGRELVNGLPSDLVRSWGDPGWSQAPVPFHNGQVLLTESEAWITLHTLEPRILEILGIPRVPVASFSTAEGVEAYLRAARRAAAELEVLYRRKVRFAHPLPENGTAAQRRAEMDRIGGGAGFDLDSYVTLLPPSSGSRPRALVADLRLGSGLLPEASAADWEALRAGYELARDPDVPKRLSAYQASVRPSRFADFLDFVASGLSRQGVAVSRLPIVFVPVDLLEDHSRMNGQPDFLLTWNNVVVEKFGSRLRAEGFSGLFRPGDRAAAASFAAAGCRLDLLPALVHSVILNGGYRCASNHLRNQRGRFSSAN